MAKLTIAGKTPKALLAQITSETKKRGKKRRSKKSALAEWNARQKKGRRAAFGARRRKPRVKAHASMGRKFCKRCRGPHTIGAHKSHGKGSFKKTHPGQFKKRGKKTSGFSMSAARFRASSKKGRRALAKTGGWSKVRTRKGGKRRGR